MRAGKETDEAAEFGESESSSDDEVGDSDEESDAQMAAKLEAANSKLSRIETDGRLFTNIHNGTLQRGRAGDLSRMSCGRLLMDTYMEITDEKEKKEWCDNEKRVVCDQCFTKDVIVARALMRRINEPLAKHLED